MGKIPYRETFPAAVNSGIDCRDCGERVGWITFNADGTNVGVCACPWTSWTSTRGGRAFRSTPLSKKKGE